VQLLQQLYRVLIEKTSRFSQAQRTASFKQRNAQLLFQLLNLPAQGWLRQMQLLGGPCEVQGLRDDAEITQVA
jgi:hypothetical protein